MKKLISIILSFMLLLNLAACNNSTQKENTDANTDMSTKEWDEVLSEAKGTQVNFYGWGGSQMTNDWIDNYLAKDLKEKYDITLNRVSMDIEEILNKLLNEKQTDSKGTMDVVWINGENFYTAKTNELLYGPFVERLPNFEKYVDQESDEVKYDFGFATEGYEAPYGKAQFVMVHDKEKVEKVPTDHLELLEFAKENPGQFTYPALPDFTGSAFVRNIVYDIVGYEQFLNMEADKETVYNAIKPAIDYLKELKPYLWRNGETYPATIAQLDNMYADGEVTMSMTYNPYSVSSKIITGEFPKTTDSFLFKNGTIGNTHFLAIPFNAQNKEGAAAVIDYILSAEAQASKSDPKNWGDLPVVEMDKLTEQEKKLFNDIDPGKGVLSSEELLNTRVPEMPANLVPIIEEIWEEELF